MKRSLGARAGSFLLLLRGTEASRSNSSESPHHPQTARKESQPARRDEQEKEARQKKLGAFRSLPVFKASFLRPGSRNEKPAATGGARSQAQAVAVERRPSLPYESDDDDDSYAEDYNHDSGRVNSRSRRRKARKTNANPKRKEVRREAEESGSGDRARNARGKELLEEEDSVETQSSTSDESESDEEETTEECVVVNSSDETDDDDSESSYADGSDDVEEERRVRRPAGAAQAEVKSKRQRERERERLKVEEEKRRQKVEKRKLKKVEKQKKREGLEEMQRQIQKLRQEKELKRQEEKDLKELRRIDKLLAREREREEKKVLKLQQKEQRQREKVLKQKQMRELILARLGRPAEAVATPISVDSVPREMEAVSSIGSSLTSEREEQTTLATESREATTLLPMKDSMALLDEVAAEQDVESGRQVDDGDVEEKKQTLDEPELSEPREYPSIVGLPSTTRGSDQQPPQEVVRITVIERRPSLPPRQVEPREEETEEAEDEDEEDGSGRRVTNRGRVTDIPALRLTDKPSAATKRSPRAKASHASSAQLIRGLIGFDELEDALFELNRQVEELRTLTN